MNCPHTPHIGKITPHLLILDSGCDLPVRDMTSKKVGIGLGPSKQKLAVIYEDNHLLCLQTWKSQTCHPVILSCCESFTHECNSDTTAM